MIAPVLSMPMSLVRLDPQEASRHAISAVVASDAGLATIEKV